ncbi:hypothetical protein LG634_24555 [Streptomyces bambusae]|uniref:hypothetical protein n=1 Tax=Streptomyces bambusae TaxID=1550616 RepID=UPI001CFCBDCE|nr:hypothetical protein [Streptomyces bambusae]MCB5167985.1 hypothetical protein [Streptomyces bambusae]
MGGEDSVLGVIIAVVGVIGSVLVARITVPGRGSAAAEADAPEQPGQLAVSPEIWTEFNRRVLALEDEVGLLKSEVQQAAARESSLLRMLRQALGIVKRANQRLRQAGLEPETVPAELRPYSID